MSRSRPRPGAARKAPPASNPARRARRRSSLGRRPDDRGGRLERLFLPASVAAQFRVLNRLLRTTPGLRLYLGCALALWLLTRSLVGHGLLAHPYGHPLLLLAQLAALVVLTLLYFGHTGLLAQGRADLRRLRAQLAAARPWEAEPAALRRVLWRGLARLLGVPGIRSDPGCSGAGWAQLAAEGQESGAPGAAEKEGEEAW